MKIMLRISNSLFSILLFQQTLNFALGILFLGGSDAMLMYLKTRKISIFEITRVFKRKISRWLLFCRSLLLCHPSDFRWSYKVDGRIQDYYNNFWMLSLITRSNCSKQDCSTIKNTHHNLDVLLSINNLGSINSGINNIISSHSLIHYWAKNIGAHSISEWSWTKSFGETLKLRIEPKRTTTDI